RLLLAPPPAVENETPREQVRARSIDSLADLLVPKETTRNRAEVAAMRVALGQAPVPDETTCLRWPTQREVAEALGVAQPQISRAFLKQVPRWGQDADLGEVRDEIAALLDEVGGVMSGAELAQALIGSRGTFANEPRRTAQAIGVVRAA